MTLTLLSLPRTGLRVDAFLEASGTFIDTAHVYADLVTQRGTKQ